MQVRVEDWCPEPQPGAWAELRTRLLPSFVDHVRWKRPQDFFHHDKMLTVLMGLQRNRAVLG